MKKKENGFIIVLVLIALMAMSFFLVTGTMTTTTTLKVSGNYTKTIDGFNLAEVGLAKSRPILETNDFNVLLTTYTAPGNALIVPTSFNKGTYEAWIEDNDDGDSNSLHDSDNIIIIRSIGHNESGGTVQIEAHIQKIVPTVPEPFPPAPASGAGAALLCGTATDISTQGSSIISGHDYALPSLPCEGSACAGTDLGGGGYSVVGESTITSSGTGFISNLSPAINGSVPDTHCNEWQTLRDELASLDTSSPYVEVLSGSQTTEVLNDCSNPKVFIINTSESVYKFSGSAELCGTVIVASNTSIEATGNVTIVGLVMVMGESADLQFTATIGTPRIFGQVIVRSISVDNQKELYTKGTAEINYSTAGLGFANQAMNNALNGGSGGGGGGLITMAWKETY